MILRRSSWFKTALVAFITIAIALPGGFGFISKFVQFIRTLTTEAEGGFTIVPIMNYLLVAAGFGFLMLWAVANGMFHDIEKPKYTFMEHEKALDEREGRSWSDS